MDEHILKLLQTEVECVLPEITQIRHRLHAEPELGLETETTAYAIRRLLADASVSLWQPLMGNDVIGEIGGGGDRTICLRADIDALPIQEESDLPYRSTIPGRMHACGHDGHTAMLLGAAMVLDKLRDRLPVGVRFVFQPGEEVWCAGRELVARGACDSCEAAYAIHGWPGLPLGCVSTRVGPLFAAGAHFDIRVRGKGCHGAMPEAGNNPIPIAARIVEALRRMHVEMSAEDGTVVSTCVFQAGSSSNVIPETALVRGTARYLAREKADRVENAIRSVAIEAAHEACAEVEIDYDRSYDLPVINTRKGVDAVRRIARSYMPASTWREAEHPTMGMEDFAFYLQGREGAMVWLGLGESAPGLHSPVFDFNDGVLGTGILLLCLLALHS